MSRVSTLARVIGDLMALPDANQGRLPGSDTECVVMYGTARPGTGLA